MHGTKLPVEERDLLGRRVDADLGGAQHLLGPYAPAVFATQIEARRREVLTMWIVVTEINPVDDAVTDLLFLQGDLLNVLLVFEVLLHDLERCAAHRRHEIGVGPKGRKARAALPELLTQRARGPALDQLDQSVNAELRVDIDK